MQDWDKVDEYRRIQTNLGLCEGVPVQGLSQRVEVWRCVEERGGERRKRETIQMNG
jgi:hypothetical protein